MSLTAAFVIFLCMFQSSKESLKVVALDIRQIWQNPSSDLLSQAMSPAVISSMMRTSEFFMANPLATDFVAGAVWVVTGNFLIHELLEKIRYKATKVTETPLNPPSLGDNQTGEGHGTTRPMSLRLPKPFSGPDIPERGSLRSLALRFGY